MKHILLALFILFFLLSLSIPLSAQDNYTVIEPLPGVEISSGENTLTSYLSGVFRFSLYAAAILAVLFIVIGGVQYVWSSISPSSKSAAKEKIWNAITGLLIVLVAFLVLETINPDLVNLELSLEPVGGGSSGGGGGQQGGGNGQGGNGNGNGGGNGNNCDPATQSCEPPPSTGCDPSTQSCEEEVRTLLEEEGITITSTDGTGNPCAPPQRTSGCTDVGGLGESAISGVIGISDECREEYASCAVTITGGSETTSHTPGSAHYRGEALDLDDSNSSLNAYIEGNTTIVGEDSSGRIIRTGTLGGTEVIILDERPSGGHWHIDFEPEDSFQHG